MNTKSNFMRLLERFRACDTSKRMALRDDLIHAVYNLRGTEHDDVYRALVCMHAGGEFQRDAAMEAVINGWRRTKDGRLPGSGKTANGSMWFEVNSPSADDVAMNALADAVEKLRSVRLEDVKRAKAKRMLSKRLHNEGYRKMWVKVNTGTLGVSDIDIIADGRKVTYAGAQMTGVTML